MREIAAVCRVSGWAQPMRNPDSFFEQSSWLSLMHWPFTCRCHIHAALVATNVENRRQAIDETASFLSCDNNSSKPLLATCGATASWQLIEQWNFRKAGSSERDGSDGLRV